MVLLFSGGLDSFVAYHYLHKPQTIYFHLNTKYSAKELMVVKKLIPSTIVETCIDFKTREEDGSAFVPYRNLHLALLANKYSDTIIIAGLADDVVNDKNEKVFQQFSYLMSEMMGRRIMVLSPFWGMTKAEVVKWFLENGGTKEELLSTISCYSSEDVLYCGKCKACYRKFCALGANGIYDLTFTNEVLMWEYYAKAMKGDHYDPKRNKNIIEQTLRVHPNWESIW
jgi:7-cyano-7-deazaguanine synthase in queuosine biosynthesis